jgi:hypothetical protein
LQLIALKSDDRFAHGWNAVEGGNGLGLVARGSG